MRHGADHGRWEVAFIAALLSVFSYTGSSIAVSKAELSIDVPACVRQFEQQVRGGKRFLSRAAGYLVFPDVYEAGFWFGGEYGEGALLVEGKIVDYYNVIGASFGLQFGAERKSMVVVFLSAKALGDFRRSCGWKVGADGSVAIAKWGVGEDINNIDFKDPVVGFIFGNEGLMFNLSLEGAKFNRIGK